MMSRNNIDPTLSDNESKSLLTGKDTDKFKHVLKEMKGSSKKSGDRVSDYKKDMKKLKGSNLK